MAQSHSQGKTLKAHTVNCLCPNAGLKRIHSPENKVITDYSESKRTRLKSVCSNTTHNRQNMSSINCRSICAGAHVQECVCRNVCAGCDTATRGALQGFCHKTTSQKQEKTSTALGPEISPSPRHNREKTQVRCGTLRRQR